MKLKMKKNSFLTRCALIVCASFAILPSTVFAGAIQVRADAWPPYNAEPNSEKPGYAVEILKAIFPDDTINYQIMPWQRAIADVTEGKIDCIIGASLTDAPGCIFPEEPVGVMKNTFFVKKGSSWKFDGLDSIKSVKLGAVKGYAYDEGALDEYIKSGTAPAVQAVAGDNPLEGNIKKLLAGRIDVVVENEPVMIWSLKQMSVPQGDVISAGTLAKPSNLFIAFAPTKPESKARAEQFSAKLKELRASGELKKILDKYEVTDWK